MILVILRQFLLIISQTQKQDLNNDGIYDGGYRSHSSPKRGISSDSISMNRKKQGRKNNGRNKIMNRLYQLIDRL